MRIGDSVLIESMHRMRISLRLFELFCERFINALTPVHDVCELLLANVDIFADTCQPGTDVFDESRQIVHRVDDFGNGEVIEYLLATFDDFAHLNNAC